MRKVRPVLDPETQPRFLPSVWPLQCPTARSDHVIATVHVHGSAEVVRPCVRSEQDNGWRDLVDIAKPADCQLGAFGVATNLAGAVAILDRVINYWSNILVGGILYLVSRKK